MSVEKEKKADIVTVANAAHVSPATVSRFFNRPELVKLATRKKIDSAVKRRRPNYSWNSQWDDWAFGPYHQQHHFCGSYSGVF